MCQFESSCTTLSPEEAAQVVEELMKEIKVRKGGRREREEGRRREGERERERRMEGGRERERKREKEDGGREGERERERRKMEGWRKGGREK